MSVQQPQGFEPPRSLKQALWRCRKKQHRKAYARWFKHGPSAEQLADELKFKAPDNLWQVIWRCRDRRYLKEYWRWLRFGPDEERDAKIFERQWEGATEKGQPAVARYYLDQRSRRQESIRHLKSDVLTFYTILAVAFAALPVLMPEQVRALIGPSVEPHVAGFLLAALVVVLASYTNKLLYPLITHFEGAAEHGEDVVHDKSYINHVRKETNNFSRTLQRGKRLFSVSKMCLNAAGAYLLLPHLFQFLQHLFS